MSLFKYVPSIVINFQNDLRNYDMIKLYYPIIVDKGHAELSFPALCGSLLVTPEQALSCRSPPETPTKERPPRSA